MPESYCVLSKIENSSAYILELPSGVPLQEAQSAWREGSLVVPFSAAHRIVLALNAPRQVVDYDEAIEIAEQGITNILRSLKKILGDSRTIEGIFIGHETHETQITILEQPIQQATRAEK